MSNKEYKVYVYNTFTDEYESVVVTKEVYKVFKRTEWNIKDNNESFYKHEIQLSGLIGGKNNTFENFKEFANEGNSVEHIAIENSEKLILYNAISKLSFLEQNLVKALYFNGLTESECARLINTSQQAVNKRKKRILKKLQKILKLGL